MLVGANSCQKTNLGLRTTYSYRNNFEKKEEKGPKSKHFLLRRMASYPLPRPSKRGFSINIQRIGLYKVYLLSESEQILYQRLKAINVE